MIWFGFPIKVLSQGISPCLALEDMVFPRKEPTNVSHESRYSP